MSVKKINLTKEIADSLGFEYASVGQILSIFEYQYEPLLISK